MTASVPLVIQRVPPGRVTPRSTSRSGRWGAAVIAAALLALLCVAAYLRPSTDGHGTHTQLGMYPCGWVLAFNKPCPTCGMTTAFAHAADGSFGRSFLTQPMGMILAVASAAGFWTALHVAATGSRLGSICATMVRARGVWLFAALLAAAWVYKLLTWKSQV